MPRRKDAPAGDEHPDRRFLTSSHAWALQTVLDVALVQAGQRPATSPASSISGRLIEAEILALMGDLLEVEVEATGERSRLAYRAQARELCSAFAELIAAQVDDRILDPFKTFEALQSGGGDRAPFLLRMATEAVHDRRVAQALCELLESSARALGPAVVGQALLVLDSPKGLRSPETLPEGLTPKYTDFLGRLMGDGQGEWGDDGAVLAIGRLEAAGLLPNLAQVTSRHSRTRWGKQALFKRACEALQRCAPWSEPQRVAESGPSVATRVAGLLEQSALPGRFMASAARDAPVSATDTQRETLITRCTEQTLRDA